MKTIFTDSFFRFVLGFVFIIVASLGITALVDRYVLSAGEHTSTPAAAETSGE